jgi:hypothetical protein
MISVLLVLVVVGFILYMVQTYVPMPAPFKTVITVVVVIFLIIWLMGVFGIADVPVPRLNR